MRVRGCRSVALGTDETQGVATARGLLTAGLLPMASAHVAGRRSLAPSFMAHLTGRAAARSPGLAPGRPRRIRYRTLTAAAQPARDDARTTDEGPRLDSADHQTHFSAGKSSCASVLPVFVFAQPGRTAGLGGDLVILRPLLGVMRGSVAALQRLVRALCVVLSQRLRGLYAWAARGLSWARDGVIARVPLSSILNTRPWLSCRSSLRS